MGTSVDQQGHNCVVAARDVRQPDENCRFVARTWLSIRVDLVSGRGEDYWPRPGRIFAAAQSHRFSQLADAIDTAFARWDRAHLYQFEFADGRRIGKPEFDDFDQRFLDGAATKLSTLAPGEQFVYEFDFGDRYKVDASVRARHRRGRPAAAPTSSAASFQVSPTSRWRSTRAIPARKSLPRWASCPCAAHPAPCAKEWRGAKRLTPTRF